MPSLYDAALAYIHHVETVGCLRPKECFSHRNYQKPLESALAAHKRREEAVKGMSETLGEIVAAWDEREMLTAHEAPPDDTRWRRIPKAVKQAKAALLALENAEKG